tara:strand:- start:169 stop:729 length:561 start_codon:yes stop_codon:yes gene_type:complete
MHSSAAEGGIFKFVTYQTDNPKIDQVSKLSTHEYTCFAKQECARLKAKGLIASSPKKALRVQSFPHTDTVISESSNPRNFSLKQQILNKALKTLEQLHPDFDIDHDLFFVENQKDKDNNTDQLSLLKNLASFIETDSCLDTPDHGQNFLSYLVILTKFIQTPSYKNSSKVLISALANFRALLKCYR